MKNPTRKSKGANEKQSYSAPMQPLARDGIQVNRYRGTKYFNAPAAIEWLCRVFGFEKQLVVPGKNDAITHAQLSFGNGMIMVGSDADAVYERAKAAKAEIVGGLGRPRFLLPRLTTRGTPCPDISGWHLSS
jgi:hypothetical protein